MIIGREKEQRELLELFTNVFTIDRDDATNLQNKIEAYQELSKDKRTLHLVMVTTNGVAHNSYYNMIQNEVTMDDLFRT